ncbi:hypothetical protein KA183_13425 [bacterium]|nr:hypothetical protein [bacterium]QQR57720.1 MAG: hypothetical protein IPG59_22570 [Candidatus Melainabacteria bacterium]
MKSKTDKPEKAEKTTRSKAKSKTMEHNLEMVRVCYEHSLTTIDYAVVSAMIAGVAPAAFTAALSYWFLQCAAMSRDKTELEFMRWSRDFDLVWNPIIEATLDFVDEFEGDVDYSSMETILMLQHKFGIKHQELDDDELSGHCDKAIAVVDFLFEKLSHEEMISVSVEMAILVMWLKVAALDDHVDPEAYPIVEQNISAVVERYSKVLSGAQTES